MRARLAAALVGTIREDLIPRVSGVWNFALGRLQSRLPLLREPLDNTSVSSAGRGEVAVGSEFIADSLKDPSEDDTSGWTLVGLHTSSAL